MRQSTNYENRLKGGETMNNQNKDIQEKLQKATPDVLSSIKQSPRFKVPEKKKTSLLDVLNQRKIKVMIPSFVLLIAMILVLTLSPSEQIYASTVTLDINPQLEITLDEEDDVIEITAFNDDGQEIINSLGNVQNKNIRNVLEILVKQLYNRGYLDNAENVMMVYVDGESEELQNHVYELVQEKIQEEVRKYRKTLQLVTRNNLDYSDQQIIKINRLAEEYNISPGRVILMIEIIDLDDSFTYRELATYRMKELYDLYNELNVE